MNGNPKVSKQTIIGPFLCVRLDSDILLGDTRDNFGYNIHCTWSARHESKAEQCGSSYRLPPSEGRAHPTSQIGKMSTSPSNLQEVGFANVTVQYAGPSLALWPVNSSWPIPPSNGTGAVGVHSANSTTSDNLFYVPPGLVVLLSVLYGSISVITVVGNALVILVIAKNKSMHTVTNFYIANLAVADVMIGIFSIPFQFQAALLQRWDLPPILCPVAPFVKELTVNVSIVTLTVISIDRYIAVIYPLKPRCSSRVAKVVMTVVWTFSFGSGIPAAVVFRVRQLVDLSDPSGHKPFCYPNFPVVNGIDLGKFYRLYTVVVQYFFPLFIICFAYFRIMHRIWGNKAPGSAMDTRDQMLNKNKRKVSRHAFIHFMIFYTPPCMF